MSLPRAFVDVPLLDPRVARPTWIPGRATYARDTRSGTKGSPQLVDGNVAREVSEFLESEIGIRVALVAAGVGVIGEVPEAERRPCRRDPVVLLLFVLPAELPVDFLRALDDVREFDDGPAEDDSARCGSVPASLPKKTAEDAIGLSTAAGAAVEDVLDRAGDECFLRTPVRRPDDGPGLLTQASAFRVPRGSTRFSLSLYRASHSSDVSV